MHICVLQNLYWQHTTLGKSSLLHKLEETRGQTHPISPTSPPEKVDLEVISTCLVSTSKGAPKSPILDLFTERKHSLHKCTSSRVPQPIAPLASFLMLTVAGLPLPFMLKTL
jgi:hypothetical protein